MFIKSLVPFAINICIVQNRVLRNLHQASTYSWALHSKYKWTSLIFFGFGMTVLLMPQLKLASLHSTYFDLGLVGHSFLFDNPMRGALDGHAYLLYPLFQFIVSLDSGYVLELMLLIQSIGIVAGACILLKYYGRNLFYLYVLAYPLWGLLLFDFHFEFMLFPLMATFFVLHDKGRVTLMFLTGILIGMVKEPYWLTVSALGVYCILSSILEFKENHVKSRVFFLGCLLVVFGIMMFWASVKYLIDSPYVVDTGNSAFAWATTFYENFKVNLSEALRVLDSEAFFDWKKLLIVLSVFSISPIIRGVDRWIFVVVIPTLLIVLLSSNSLHHKINSHYYAVFVVPLIVSAKKIDFRWYYFVIPFAFHFAFSGSPVSLLFWSDFSWAYNHKAYQIDDSSKQLRKYLGEDFVLNASSVMVQNNIVTSSLVNHKKFEVFPSHLNQSVAFTMPDVVVLANDRPLFINDQSCDWRFGKCTNSDFVGRYEHFVSLLRNNFTKENIGSFTVYKKLSSSYH